MVCEWAPDGRGWELTEVIEFSYGEGVEKTEQERPDDEGEDRRNGDGKQAH